MRDLRRLEAGDFWFFKKLEIHKFRWDFDLIFLKKKFPPDSVSISCGNNLFNVLSTLSHYCYTADFVKLKKATHTDGNQSLTLVVTLSARVVKNTRLEIFFLVENGGKCGGRYQLQFKSNNKVVSFRRNNTIAYE